MRRRALISLLVLFSADQAAAKLRIGDPRSLAVDRLLSPAIQSLTVASPAADPNKPMAALYTAEGRNISPPVSWDGAPPNARAFVVIMEDADSHGSRPSLDWLVYNIPGAAREIPKDLRPPQPSPKNKTDGPFLGRNYLGGLGYVGPNPPPGDPPHHYHIEVFALARPVRLGAGASLEKVLGAMNEDVLAAGETVATFSLTPPTKPDDDPG